jgi:tRNA threonylcarbamoyladenosine dehydratase
MCVVSLPAQESFELCPSHGTQAVYSSELAERKLAPLDASVPAHERGTMDNFRVRVLPVLGPLPAIFGDTMAAYVLCGIAGQPFQCVMPC